MSKKFGAPGSVETFGLRQEETMSEAEKLMATEKAVEALLGNAEERDAAKKHLADFLGLEQSDKNLLDWASKDSHFKNIVSFCKKYTDKQKSLDELRRDLFVFGIKDEDTLRNFLNIVIKHS